MLAGCAQGISFFSKLNRADHSLLGFVRVYRSFAQEVRLQRRDTSRGCSSPVPQAKRAAAGHSKLLIRPRGRANVADQTAIGCSVSAIFAELEEVINRGEATEQWGL